MGKNDEREGLVRVLCEVAGKSGVARVHVTAGMPKVKEMMDAIRGASCPRAALAKAETTYQKYVQTFAGAVFRHEWPSHCGCTCAAFLSEK